MRSLALIFLACLLAISVAAQPGKKPAAKPKQKPLATPVKKLDEGAAWEAAIAIAGNAERVGALKKFEKDFPRSERLGEARNLTASAEAALGSERLAAGDVAGAVSYFQAAVKDAPAPIADELFNKSLVRAPTDLYFRGARTEALEIARSLEEKVAENSSRLLALAVFYLNIESGSAAKRLAEAALKIEPESPAAYETLAFAHRVDFQLEESAAAYAKALELQPESLAAKRGLAEMNRALGKPDEAAALYREILEKEADNVPAQTGLVLSLFDAGKRTDAEAEMAKALEGTPGNIILLAGAAYWYAAHDLPDKAVEHARKAVDTDPRFIWSHIALARGLLGQKKAAEAERTLLAARRYGNFPTLEYEIASARVAAGYYREAAEELAKSFAVKDGVVRTVLGGRIPRESNNFTELVGFERRASIFAPTAADSPENAARLTALLEFKQQLDAAEPKGELVARAADEFIKGDDRMKVHRQIFAASKMLERQVALPAVVEIAKAAVQNVASGLDDPNAAFAVTAAELYEPRAMAAARGEYVDVPQIPRMTLSAIIRGQIEEIGGWASFHLNDTDEAVLRLRRAVAVLPADSAWWRSSSWRLGVALSAAGNDAEALDTLIKSYKSSVPNPVGYATIEALYKKVKGSTEGLEALIGRNPAVISDTVAQVLSTLEPAASPAPDASPEVTDIPSVVPVATPLADEPTPTPEPAATPESTPAVEEKKQPTGEPASTPDVVVTSTPVATPDAAPAAVLPSPEATPVPEPSPTQAAEPTPVSRVRPMADLFPPVVITIPQPETRKLQTPTPTPEVSPDADPEPSPAPASERTLIAENRPRFADTRPVPAAAQVKPCKMTFNSEAVDLQPDGDEFAVIVARDDAAELGEISAVSSSPRDVSVKRQPLPGTKTQALFILRPLSERTGVFQITFEMACAKRDLTVRVR